MSLKVFHIIFITLSVILAFGFGLWLLISGPGEVAQTNIIAALLSFGVGILLVLYEIKIVRKFRSLKPTGSE